MNLSKLIKKAMIDKDIDTLEALSMATGLSKAKCVRLLNDDKTIRLMDVETVLGVLGYQLKAEVNHNGY